MSMALQKCMVDQNLVGDAIDMIAGGHVSFDETTRCRNIIFD